MPEGDTIFRAARALGRALAGNHVESFETNLALLARRDDHHSIGGRMISSVRANGKWLFIEFSGDLILASHMLMSGSWHLYRIGEKWRLPRSRMRAVIRTIDWEAVAFNVPIMEFHTTLSLRRSRKIASIGKDILADGFSTDGGVEQLLNYALREPDSEVGSTLLNQKVLAGLGNVYKSEVAFAARVNPFRKLRSLRTTEIEQLVDAAQRYMRVNVAEEKGDGILTYSGLRRTTHSMDREDRLWVYGRGGRECRRCGALILMRRQGEHARSTYWCPDCQPL